MVQTNKQRKRRPSQSRRGKPLVVYFTDEQAQALRAVAEDRHITQTAVIRFAVDQVLKKFQSGQLELPLGV
jgi:anti-sigma-K factor RskA